MLWAAPKSSAWVKVPRGGGTRPNSGESRPPWGIHGSLEFLKKYTLVEINVERLMGKLAKLISGEFVGIFCALGFTDIALSFVCLRRKRKPVRMGFTREQF